MVLGHGEVTLRKDRALVRELRYRIVDRIRGVDAIGRLARLRQQQFEDPESLAQQTRAARDLYFRALRDSVPMFRNVSRFEDLPIVDKAFVNAHRDVLMNPHYQGKLIRKKTGGSTGEPFVYYTSPEAQSQLWAGIFLSWEAAGFHLGDRVAFLAGSALFGSGWKQRVYYRMLNVTPFSAFDMSDETLARYARDLAEGQFRLLYGYASAVHRLAHHLLANPSSVPRFALRGVVCTAEVLTPSMRAEIEAAFGAPCFNQYGCQDAGVSAFECDQHTGLHLISTRSYTEAQPGGQLVSTDLANTAMFMPRYDTGDLVRFSSRFCPCGRGLPLIEEVRGRQNDMVTDSEGHCVHSEFFTHLFREDSSIRSFQVVFDDQELVVNAHVDLQDLAEHRASCERYVERIRQSLRFRDIRFEQNHDFVTSANGKHRFVLRRTTNSGDSSAT